MRTGLYLAAITENRENAAIFLPIQSRSALSCEARVNLRKKPEHAWRWLGEPRSGVDTGETDRFALCQDESKCQGKLETR